MCRVKIVASFLILCATALSADQQQATDWRNATLEARDLALTAKATAENQSYAGYGATMLLWQSLLDQYDEGHLSEDDLALVTACKDAIVADLKQFTDIPENTNLFPIASGLMDSVTTYKQQGDYWFYVPNFDYSYAAYASAFANYMEAKAKYELIRLYKIDTLTKYTIMDSYRE